MHCDEHRKGECDKMQLENYLDWMVREGLLKGCDNSKLYQEEARFKELWRKHSTDGRLAPEP